MVDESLEKFMRHIFEMRQLTNVEVINTYWQQADQIATTGKLGFIIRGNVSWEPSLVEGISRDDIWLKSNRYDPIGKHISERPVQTYLQWYLNLYEIWGTINIDIDPNDSLASKSSIEEALEKITIVNNSLSLLIGASVRWYPARYAQIRHVPLPPLPDQEETESWDCLPLRRSQDEHSTIILNDSFIRDDLFPFIYEVETLPTIIKPVISTALEWHTLANTFASGLNRFLNYWSSIELLGFFFYRHLHNYEGIKLNKKQKREKIMKIINDELTYRNCLEIVRKCNEIRNPTTRTRMLSFLDIIADKNLMEDLLFNPDEKSKKSLYQIRNDIAHGNISEHDFETLENLRHRLLDARRISREIILRTIYNKEKLICKINQNM